MRFQLHPTHNSRRPHLLTSLSSHSRRPHHHHGHHHHGHHPLIKYVLLRRRMCCLCAPEAWLLRIEDVVCWTASLIRSARKITGRRVLGILMVMAVVSLFLKISVMSSVHMDWMGKPSSSRNKNFMFHHKYDLSSTQKIVSEIDDSTTSSSTSSAVSGGSVVMPKRVLEKYLIPEIWRKPDSDNFYQCISRPRIGRKIGGPTNGYLLIHANGGLNQMRTGILNFRRMMPWRPSTFVLLFALS